MRSTKSRAEDASTRQVIQAAAVEAMLAEGRARIMATLTRGIEQLRNGYQAELDKAIAQADKDRQDLIVRLEAAENAAELLGRQIAELKVRTGRQSAAQKGTALRAREPKQESVGRRSAPRPSKSTTVGEGLPPKTDLARWLTAQGIEVIDNRGSRNGSLWVVGSRTVLKGVIESLRHQGIAFTFVPGGGKTTGGRPAWFTKSPR